MPSPPQLSRHDVLESLVVVLIPFAYVVWKHGHPPMTGVLTALGCGAMFIVGKYLLRHAPQLFHRHPHCALTLVDGCVCFTEDNVTRWSVKVKELIGHDDANTPSMAAHGVIRLHTATRHYAIPAHRFRAADIVALLGAAGLKHTAPPTIET